MLPTPTMMARTTSANTSSGSFEPLEISQKIVPDHSQLCCICWVCHAESWPCTCKPSGCS